MDESDGYRLQLPLSLLLGAIALGGAVDLVLDRPERWLSIHVIYEVVLVLGASGIAIWLWQGWRTAEGEGRRLRHSLAEQQAERDAWRASAEEALAGFSQAVSRQFETWNLTPAEREIALELLRGRSHREIAEATNRSERTVRQHAVAIYQKAGVDGRAELAGFFLGGVTLPAGPAS